jgi:hypothetical protein
LYQRFQTNAQSHHPRDVSPTIIDELEAATSAAREWLRLGDSDDAFRVDPRGNDWYSILHPPLPGRRAPLATKIDGVVLDISALLEGATHQMSNDDLRQLPTRPGAFGLLRGLEFAEVPTALVAGRRQIAMTGFLGKQHLCLPNMEVVRPSLDGWSSSIRSRLGATVALVASGQMTQKMHTAAKGYFPHLVPVAVGAMNTQEALHEDVRWVPDLSDLRVEDGEHSPLLSRNDDQPSAQLYATTPEAIAATLTEGGSWRNAAKPIPLYFSPPGSELGAIAL